MVYSHYDHEVHIPTIIVISTANLLSGNVCCQLPVMWYNCGWFQQHAAGVTRIV